MGVVTNNEINTAMKTHTTLLLAGAVALGFTLTTQTRLTSRRLLGCSNN